MRSMIGGSAAAPANCQLHFNISARHQRAGTRLSLRLPRMISSCLCVPLLGDAASLRALLKFLLLKGWNQVTPTAKTEPQLEGALPTHLHSQRNNRDKDFRVLKARASAALAVFNDQNKHWLFCREGTTYFLRVFT